MVEVKKYNLPPTPLVPNSPYPLLHYPGLLASQIAASQSHIAPEINTLFHSNGWRTQWIFRYGRTQQSHYHSGAHECMAVLSGTATIRFGVADTDHADLDASTYGTAREAGGIELKAQAGDVFILPAGLAHKTYDTTEATFTLLTPGGGHGLGVGADSDGGVGDDIEGVEGVEAENEVLGKIELTGFTMIGAYPKDGSTWDFQLGGEDEGEFERVWAVKRPEKDPVLGDAEEGLCRTWT